MIKKKDIVRLEIEHLAFPKKGWGQVEGIPVKVKEVLPGQLVEVRITKKREGQMEGQLLQVIRRAPYETRQPCRSFARCGGCTYQTISLEKENEMKESQVLELLEQAGVTGYTYDGIQTSPTTRGYRNKCEFSFGDTGKDGALALGMRRRHSFYEVETLPAECDLVDGDFIKIIQGTLSFFSAHPTSFYHKGRHEGVLRHLVVRKGYYTGEILLNLVTTSAGTEVPYAAWVQAILALPLAGKICGILHTVNDSVADVVQSDGTVLLYGQAYLTDRLFDLTFRITAGSFFQTNTAGAEALYQMVKDYVGQTKDTVLFDLYCGTGTISQVLAGQCRQVIGVELVEEAVKAARENAAQNGIENCTFLAGDVLEVVEQLEQKPDIIVVDPPRDGIHPKAIGKIIAFGAPRIIYVSCKPSSLARDLAIFQGNGYQVERLGMLNQFCHTEHIETVALLTKKENV